MATAAPMTSTPPTTPTAIQALLDFFLGGGGASDTAVRFGLGAAVVVGAALARLSLGWATAGAAGSDGVSGSAASDFCSSAMRRVTSSFSLARGLAAMYFWKYSSAIDRLPSSTATWAMLYRNSGSG